MAQNTLNISPSGKPEITSTRPLLATDVENLTTQFYWDPAQGGNGHIYEYVSSNLTPPQIFEITATASLKGYQGYLATVTSAAEDAAIFERFSGNFGGAVLLGATDTAVEGQWRWVTGPEAGTLFWVGKADGAAIGTSYNHWAGVEPNNGWGDSPESWNNDYMGYFGSDWWSVNASLKGGWVDLFSWEAYQGYIVEYSSAPTPVSGSLKVGQAVYADKTTLADPDGVGAVDWQWQRSPDNGGSWVDVQAATQGSYTLTDSDAGALIRLKASYVDGGGTAEVVYSDASPVMTSGASAPSITSNGGGDAAAISIAENGTTVTTVTATDTDASTTLIYTITGGADAAKFQINAATGALSFTTAPNFEAPTDAGGNNVYDIVVQASDGSLTDTQALAVTVTNANEAPVIIRDGGGTTKIGSEFLVNTATTGSQMYPKIAALSNGNFIVTWQDGDPPNGVAGSGTLGDSGGSSIKGQLFGPSGDKLGSEFLVNTQTGNNQLSPHVAALSNDSFVVSWWDGSGTLGDPSGSIKAQVFRGDGVKIGGEFLVNTQTASDQTFPTITSLSNGGFVVTWQDGPRWGGVGSGTLGDTGGSSIKMQIFSAGGTKVGSEKLVNTETAADQLYPRIAGLSNGGFVVTWYDFSGTLGDADGPSIKAQVFGADGAKVGSEVLVNTETASGQWIPSVTGLANGRFVVTWSDDSGTYGDSSGRSVKAQIFGADGTKVGGEFLVNSETAGDQDNPAIAGLPNGGFIATWTDFSGTMGDADGGSVKAQAFDANGARVGSEFLVNTQTTSNQTTPAVTALTNGNIAISWIDQSGTLGDASGHSIKAQILDAGTATGSAFTQGQTVYTDASDISDPEGISGPDTAGRITWYWQRSADNGATWTDIGASGSTIAEGSVGQYQLTQLDVGKLVRSVTTYTDLAGNIETVYSAASTPVANVNDPASGVLRIVSQSPRQLTTSDVTDPSSQFFWAQTDGGNGHIYEYVEVQSGSISPLDANSQAANKVVGGANGYLVTLTTAQEDAAVWQHFSSKMQSSGGTLLGASDATVEGQWRWIGGPEAGQLVGYTNWAGGEPNNGLGGQNYLNYFPVSWWPGWGGKWDDAWTNTSVSGLRGFIVEYSADPAPAAIQSDFTQGRTINADASQITDPDGLGTIAWQWQRSSDNGLTWTDISGATKASYTLLQADVGKLVRSEASYTDNGGTLETVFSAASTAVAGANAAPSITSNGGGATATAAIAENSTAITMVTASDSDAGTTLVYSISGGADAARFQINASTGALSFKTAPNFEAPTDAGANNVYDVTVQVSDGSLTDTQALAVTVTNANEQPSGSVAITGTATVGSALTASHTVVDPDGAGSGGYQWTRNGSNITGATGAKYTLTNADAGQAIAVTLTYTDGGGFRQSVASTGLTVSALDPAVRITGSDFTTGEDGGTAVFSVSLTKAPVDPVTITFSVSDASEGSIATNVLTFTSANWNVAQTLTVTGVDDYLNDANVAYDLQAVISTRDLSYQRVTIASVALSNTDDGQDAPVYLYGDNGIDYLTGLNGNDRLYGGGNLDELRGGRGNDRLYGQEDNDRLYGELGNDDLYGGYDDDELNGGDGKDRLYGEGGEDRLEGGAGDDLLDGGIGADTMIGGAGNDTYYIDDIGDVIDDQGASTDVDTVLVLATIQYTLAANVDNAALGQDSGDAGLTGNTLNNDLTGNAGRNALAGGSGSDVLDGGAGNDVLNGGSGRDVLVGGAGNDKISGGTGTDTADFADAQGNVIVDLTTNRATGDGADTLASIENVTMGGGDDVVMGSAGANTLNGGIGDDKLTGGGGGDVLVGGSGNDTLYAGDGDDAVNAGSGNDIIVGGDGAGNDRYNGGTGVDTVKYTSAKAGITVNLAAASDQAKSTAAGDAAGIGIDQLSAIENVIAGNFSDKITGDSAGNSLFGMRGNDVLSGGAGNDKLFGGAGADTLIGGTGADRFVFDTAPTSRDTIRDFSRAQGDKIQLSKAVFKGFAYTGLLDADDFYAAAGATKAQDAADRIIYNTTTGVLYYDSDGLGGAAAVQVALLGTATHPSLTFSDLQIIA